MGSVVYSFENKAITTLEIFFVTNVISSKNRDKKDKRTGTSVCMVCNKWVACV